MKLTIGENIRSFRKKNDLTQEAFADRLGVTCQSVSRWENGTTYPDLELLPAISELLSVTVDELIGLPRIEKEKRAVETFDALRRECMQADYDADRIVELLKDIRRNYIDSESAWRPWCEGNDRAFRDPKILPEVRLFAEKYLEYDPMYPPTIATMVSIEDEEHLEDFLSKNTTAYDSSARALLFDRYWRRGDAERFEPERRWRLERTFADLLDNRYFLKLGADKESRIAAEEFMEALLSLIRRDAADERPDIWVCWRIEQGFDAVKRLVENGKPNDAIAKLTSTVELLEKTMEIKDEVLLPTSCRFLDGMEWKAEEKWETPCNDPDRLKERTILIWTEIGGMSSCVGVRPSEHFNTLQNGAFDPIRDTPEFQSLCERVKALIVTREQEK